MAITLRHLASGEFMDGENREWTIHMTERGGVLLLQTVADEGVVTLALPRDLAGALGSILNEFASTGDIGRETR